MWSKKKCKRRVKDAWRGWTGNAYLPPIEIKLTINNLVILESTSEQLYLGTKWGGTEPGEWREILSPWPVGENLQLLMAEGDRLGLHVKWNQ